MLTRETDVRFKRGRHAFVLGVDEAGRGPLAGPVVAAAVGFLDGGLEVDGVRDSKQMDEEERERVFPMLTQSSSILWAVSVVDHQEIDQVNILQATMNAMTRAVERLLESSPDLKRNSCLALVDGAETYSKMTPSADPLH